MHRWILVCGIFRVRIRSQHSFFFLLSLLVQLKPSLRLLWTRLHEEMLLSHMWRFKLCTQRSSRRFRAVGEKLPVARRCRVVCDFFSLFFPTADAAASGGPESLHFTATNCIQLRRRQLAWRSIAAEGQVYQKKTNQISRHSNKEAVTGGWSSAVNLQACSA